MPRPFAVDAYVGDRRAEAGGARWGDRGWKCEWFDADGEHVVEEARFGELDDALAWLRANGATRAEVWAVIDVRWPGRPPRAKGKKEVPIGGAS